jgi:hypothetical protein
MLRDKNKDQAYFNEYIDFNAYAINHRLERLEKLKNDKKSGSVDEMLRYSIGRLIMRYGRGDSLQDINDSVEQTFDILKLRKRIFDTVPMDISVKLMWEHLSLERLYEFLTIFSFLVALGSSAEKNKEILGLINNTKEDALLNLFATFVSNSNPNQNVPVRVPNVYGKLATVINSSPSDRASLMKEFMDSWYQLMSPIAWHDNLKGGEGAYFGYWAFDVALVVMILDIDDASFRDNQYYPKDLVAFYRNR